MNKKSKTVKIVKRVLTMTEADETTALRRIVIKRDECPDNPRNWCNVFTIYAGEHNRYLANDKGAFDPVVDVKKDGTPIFRDGIWAIPLYIYAHSGVAFSVSPFSDPWDSGQGGWLYVDKAEFCKEYELKRFSPRRAMKIAQGEVETLQIYSDGNVYGCVEQTRETPEDEWEDGYSCYGFYGDEIIGEMVSEAGGYEKGTIICEDEEAYWGKGEVEMVVLQEYYNRVNNNDNPKRAA